MALQPGDRVELVATDDPSTRLRPGDRGTVTGVRTHPEPTIDVQWDDGSTLSVLPESGEHLSKLPGDHTPTHADPASGLPTTTRPPAGQRRRAAVASPGRPDPHPAHPPTRRRYQTTPGGASGGHPIGYRPPDPRGGRCGSYCHYDGYPAHQCRVLFEAVTGHFGGDTDAACSYLLDEHPAGWSVLHGDVTTPPGYRLPSDPDDLRNQCYCHGDRHDPPRAPLDDHTAREAWVGYAYVIGPDRLQVRPACTAAGSRSPIRPGPTPPNGMPSTATPTTCAASTNRHGLPTASDQTSIGRHWSPRHQEPKRAGVRGAFIPGSPPGALVAAGDTT